MPPQNPPPAERPQNSWLPIALAFAVLVFSTIVVIVGNHYFHGDERPGGGPAATTSPTASATPAKSPSA